MSRLVKNGQAFPNEWKLLRLAAGEAPEDVRLPVGQVLVPWQVWQARRRELVHREYEHGWALGVWLPAGGIPQSLERDIDNFSVIAIELGGTEVGNGHAVPGLLRGRYGYTGELRAVGDISRDWLASLRQAGFDTIQLREGANGQSAVSRLLNFNPADAALGQAAA